MRWVSPAWVSTAWLWYAQSVDDNPNVPKRQRQHYVPRWILRGFTDSKGWLHAWRVDDERGFRCQPEAVFAEVNINTALSDDGEDILASSEGAYSWLDQHGSSAAYAIRDAARAAVWHPREAKVVGATPETLSWFTGLPLRQFTRTPEVRRNAEEVADRFDLTGEQTRVLQVAGSWDRLPNAEDHLNTGRPIVLRSSPQHSLIVGDDVVVRGVPLEDGKASFLGILIDQHTVIGRGFVPGRPQLAPGEIE